MKFLWKELYKEINTNREGSFRQISRRHKLNVSIFTRIKQGKTISVINLIKIMKACGIAISSLERFVKF